MVIPGDKRSVHDAAEGAYNRVPAFRDDLAQCLLWTFRKFVCFNQPKEAKYA